METGIIVPQQETFGEFELRESDVGRLAKERIHLPHFDPNQAVIEQADVKAVRFLPHSVCLLILRHEVDVVPLALILTSRAIHGVVH